MIAPYKKPKAAKKPVPTKVITSASFASAPGASTLDRVKECIDPYTSVNPIENHYHVGALVKDLDFLGLDLNIEFGLAGKQRYWQGEIEGEWSVRYLADYTDLKRKVKP
jgi:hypothetical protein